MYDLTKVSPRRRQRASARRHFRHGYRAAAVRAFTGAEIYLDKKVPNLAAAAMHCGSNVQYVQAAIVLIQAEALHPWKMRQSVLEGRVPLLAAAHEARRRQKAARVTVEEMTAAWRGWTSSQRAYFGRSVGVAEIWDFSIVPVISEERGELACAVAAE
jgi:hypothetical protein